MIREDPHSIEFWKIIVPIVVGVLGLIVVALGWGVVHYLSIKRDQQNKRRELVTSYLIDAYRNIENGCGRDKSITADQKAKMEQAIADVQLFGSQKQIKMAKEFADGMNKNSYGDPRQLLAQFRNDLRKELNLEKASVEPNDIIHWRLK